MGTRATAVGLAYKDVSTTPDRHVFLPAPSGAEPPSDSSPPPRVAFSAPQCIPFANAPFLFDDVTPPTNLLRVARADAAGGVRRIVCIYKFLFSRKSKIRDIHVDVHKIFDMLLPIILGKGQLYKRK